MSSGHLRIPTNTGADPAHSGPPGFTFRIKAAADHLTPPDQVAALIGSFVQPPSNICGFPAETFEINLEKKNI